MDGASQIEAASQSRPGPRRASRPARRAHSRSYAACSKHLPAPAETFEKDKEGSASQDRGIANWSPAPQVCCIDGDGRELLATVRGARINPKKVRAYTNGQVKSQCRQRRHYHLDNAHRLACRTHAVSTPAPMQCISRRHGMALFKTPRRPRAHRIELPELSMRMAQRGDPWTLAWSLTLLIKRCLSLPQPSLLGRDSECEVESFRSVL